MTGSRPRVPGVRCRASPLVWPCAPAGVAPSLSGDRPDRVVVAPSRRSTMASRPTIETRFEQMFPTLSPAEIDRLRHFGAARSYDAGERLVGAGEISPGMFVVLKGEVAITQRSAL